MTHGGHNERFLRIVQRNQVTSRSLAQKSGLNEGHVSRILDGQYSIPVELLRAAWSLTGGDAELVALALDDNVAVTRIDHTQRDRSRPEMLTLAIHAGAQVTASISRALNGSPEPLAPALNALASTLATVAYTEQLRQPLSSPSPSSSSSKGAA